MDMEECWYAYGMTELWKGHGWRVVLEETALPDGRVKKVARVSRPDSVHVIAFPGGGGKNILLLREFRPYYGQWLWMLPSGRADKEDDLITAAQRELQEETGYKAGRIEHYCTTNHSESLISSNHIFLAYDLQPSSLPQDDDELIEVHTVDVPEALDRVLTSPKVHTASAFALLRYLRERA